MAFADMLDYNSIQAAALRGAKPGAQDMAQEVPKTPAEAQAAGEAERIAGNGAGDKPAEGAAEYRASTELSPGGSAADPVQEVDPPPRRLPQPPKAEKGDVPKAKDVPAAKKPAIKEAKPVKAKDAEGQFPSVCIQGFPKGLMQRVRAMFPDADRNNDALAAFVYIHLGQPADVPDEVKALAKCFTGDKVMQDIEGRMQALEGLARDSYKVLGALELASAALMADHKQLSKNSPSTGGGIDFLEEDTLGALAKLRTDARELRARELRDAGRNLGSFRGNNG